MEHAPLIVVGIIIFAIVTMFILELARMNKPPTSQHQRRMQSYGRRAERQGNKTYDDYDYEDRRTSSSSSSSSSSSGGD